jgi:hypothetical protein
VSRRTVNAVDQQEEIRKAYGLRKFSRPNLTTVIEFGAHAFGTTSMAMPFLWWT